jgi:S1-C subfamily serine protease
MRTTSWTWDLMFFTLLVLILTLSFGGYVEAQDITGGVVKIAKPSAKPKSTSHPSKSTNRPRATTSLQAIPVNPNEDPSVNNSMGVEVIEKAHYIEKFGLYVWSIQPDSEDTYGIWVWKVDPSGPAATAGIKTGDVITKVNNVILWFSNNKKKHIVDLIAALRLSGNRPARVEIIRDLFSEPDNSGRVPESKTYKLILHPRP